MAEQPRRDEKQFRNQRHWQAHVNAQQKSGLSRSGYCRQHNISYHALTYWHRKFSRPNHNATSLVPVTMKHFMGPNPVQPDRAALKVILPGRLSIEVGDNFSPTTLSRLLATLEDR